MKKIVLFFISLSFTLSSFGQDTLALDTTWVRGGFASFQFNQTTFTNWAAGGENSYSLNALAFVFANYHFEKNYWNSYVHMNYGLISSQYDKSIRKNTDFIELQTKAGHEIGKKFYYTGLLNFRSQFANGYVYPNDSVVVSKFLAPGYLTASIGVEWKPVDYFAIYVSPTTGRLTFVMDQEIADQVTNGASLWGTEPAVYDSNGVLITHGKNINAEFGAYLSATFLKEVVKNVSVASKVQLFNNYTDKNKANRKNVDVLWDLLVNMKINSWLSAYLSANLIYDNDIVIQDLNDDGVPTGTAGPRTQFKESFGLGLTFNFGDPVPK
ncbi:MAG: DUF3078 domain-containing protein [Chloroflexi bacterium]|nr:DUF3078 domain-containing protein [Chloroflexota bacterium]